MKSNKDEKQLFENAKKKVKRVKFFYLHLAFYIIGIALMLYNFYIMEGPYTSIITGLNISTIVLWSIFISIHAWNVFKGKLLFKKSWEDRKIEEYLGDKEEQQRWE